MDLVITLVLLLWEPFLCGFTWCHFTIDMTKIIVCQSSHLICIGFGLSHSLKNIAFVDGGAGFGPRWSWRRRFVGPMQIDGPSQPIVDSLPHMEQHIENPTIVTKFVNCFCVPFQCPITSTAVFSSQDPKGWGMWWPLLFLTPFFLLGFRWGGGGGLG